MKPLDGAMKKHLQHIKIYTILGIILERVHSWPSVGSDPTGTLHWPKHLACGVKRNISREKIMSERANERTNERTDGSVTDVISWTENSEHGWIRVDSDLQARWKVGGWSAASLPESSGQHVRWPVRSMRSVWFDKMVVRTLKNVKTGHSESKDNTNALGKTEMLFSNFWIDFVCNI